MKDEFVKKFTKSIKEADYSELRNIVAEGHKKLVILWQQIHRQKSVKLFYIRKRNWRNYPAMLVRINADGCLRLALYSLSFFNPSHPDHILL